MVRAGDTVIIKDREGLLSGYSWVGDAIVIRLGCGSVVRAGGRHYY